MRGYEFLKGETINGVSFSIIRTRNGSCIAEHKLYATIDSVDDDYVRISISTTRSIIINNPLTTSSSSYARVVNKLYSHKLEYNRECFHIRVKTEEYTTIPKKLVLEYNAPDYRFDTEMSIVSQDAYSSQLDRVVLVLDPTNPYSDGDLAITPIFVNDVEGAKCRLVRITKTDSSNPQIQERQFFIAKIFQHNVRLYDPISMGIMCSDFKGEYATL